MAVDFYELPPANGSSRSSGIRDRRPATSFRNQRRRLTDLETRRRCLLEAGVKSMMSAFGPRVPRLAGPAASRALTEGNVDEAHQHQEMEDASTTASAEDAEG